MKSIVDYNLDENSIYKFYARVAMELIKSILLDSDVITSKEFSNIVAEANRSVKD